jgi:hypothetical protein
MTGGAGVAAGLRAWAAGMYETEAAAELLIRACRGLLVNPGRPWIQSSRSGYWLDTDALGSAAVSAGERRVLAVVQALATAGPLWNVGGVLAGLDRSQLALVLASLAHAGGSHEQVHVTVTETGLSFEPLPALVPWPAPATADAAGSAR